MTYCARPKGGHDDPGNIFGAKMLEDSGTISSTSGQGFKVSRAQRYKQHPWRRWTRGNSAGSLQQDQHWCNLQRAVRCRAPTLRKWKERQMEPAWGGGGPKLENNSAGVPGSSCLGSYLFLFLSKLTAFWKFSITVAIMMHFYQIIMPMKLLRLFSFF